MNTEPTIERPSDFLAKGFPYCSIFGESWHEMAAESYLKALVALGDTWQKLTPAQVREACQTHKIPLSSWSAVSNDERLQRVMDVLTGPEQARAFSSFWNR